MSRVEKMSTKQVYLTAGVGWIIIIFAGIIAEFALRMTLIDFDDPAGTIKNISDAKNLFKLSIFLDIVMITADIIVGIAIYHIIKPVNKDLAILAIVFRVTMAIIILVNLLNLVIVLLLLGGDLYASSFTFEQTENWVMIFLELHGHGYDISLVFFGLHLMLVGYLFYKSDNLPSKPGILLLFASIGYIGDSLASLLFPGEKGVLVLTSQLLIGIAVLAEVTISIWLILNSNSTQEN